MYDVNDDDYDNGNDGQVNTFARATTTDDDDEEERRICCHTFSASGPAHRPTWLKNLDPIATIII